MVEGRTGSGEQLLCATIKHTLSSHPSQSRFTPIALACDNQSHPQFGSIRDDFGVSPQQRFSCRSVNDREEASHRMGCSFVATMVACPIASRATQCMEASAGSNLATAILQGHPAPAGRSPEMPSSTGPALRPRCRAALRTQFCRPPHPQASRHAVADGGDRCRLLRPRSQTHPELLQTT